MPNAQLNMIPGQRYKIVYRSGTQRKDHYSVLDFLHDDPNGEYVFSARPDAGTQIMPKRWVKYIQHVDKATPIKIDSIVR